MPFRDDFDCLWCGRRERAGDRSDLGGWASLCGDCLGRASENGFLSLRVRSAIRERSAAGSPSGAASAARGHDTTDDTNTGDDTNTRDDLDDMDDWYLRRGRHGRGPLHDMPWQMELDEATRWLDDQPASGVIVELAGGSGWWSPLFADKGELWVYDADPRALDAARRRLVAHSLRAHLHERDPRAEPDRQVDTVFGAFLMGGVPVDVLPAQLALVRRWLRPAGTYLFVEAAARPDSERTGDPDEPVVLGPRGPIRARQEEPVRRALAAAGFEDVEVGRTASAFLMGRATRSATEWIDSGRI